MERELALYGTEELSFELTGRLARDKALALVPPGLDLVEHEGFAEVGLSIFRMRGLRVRGVPGPGFDYSEALWRLTVEHAGRKAWYAIACDLDSFWVRRTAQLLIRYPVRAASFSLARGRFEVRAASARLEIELHDVPTAATEPRGPRPVLVGSAGRLWRVPWAEIQAPASARVSVDVRDDTLSRRTLGPVDWAPLAERLEGRGHRCDFAQPIA